MQNDKYRTEGFLPTHWVLCGIEDKLEQQLKKIVSFSSSDRETVLFYTYFFVVIEGFKDGVLPGVLLLSR